MAICKSCPWATFSSSGKNFNQRIFVVICDFCISGEDALKEALRFLTLIGFSETMLLGTSDVTVDIEFFDAPDVLRIYSRERTPSICNISPLGISFYLITAPPYMALTTKEGNCDGVVFCPMSNVKTINSFGELTL